MTRVNCIPPKLLLDEHLQAHMREGLRPLNDVLDGKTNLSGCPKDWKLNSGHVKFCRKHLLFTLRQWDAAKEEYISRGMKGFDYSYGDISGIPNVYLNDYIPSRRALRENIARIIQRWRNRDIVYHFHGKPVTTIQEFRKYINYVKEECGILPVCTAQSYLESLKSRRKF